MAAAGSGESGNAVDDQTLSQQPQRERERELASRAAMLRLERQRLDREEAALRLEAASISALKKKERRREETGSARKVVDDALRGKAPPSPSSPSSPPPRPPPIYPPRGPHSELVSARVRRDRAARPQRVAELLSLIERGGGDLPPDPRVPAEALAAAETGPEFRGRALRSRAEAELALAEAEVSDSKRAKDPLGVTHARPLEGD